MYIYPIYYETDICCICGDYVNSCPCTFDDFLQHGEMCHGMTEIEISQSKFQARLMNPNTIIHADSDDGSKTICGLEIDIGMITSSESEMSNCPACNSM